jgi:hypothetical protein
MFIAICLVALAVLIVGLFFRKRIEAWLSHKQEHTE